MSQTEMSLAGMRCLVLDDEFLIALDIQTILETAGARSVICASNAGDALSALHDGVTFDLAVLDFKLNGPTRTSEVVALALTQQGTPFVFLTGLNDQETELKKFSHVPTVYKPYQVASLLAAIIKALSDS